MSLLHFEDFIPGAVVEFGDRLVTAEEIVAFARLYDPQFFHLDAEAARASQVGELIASGWHVGVILMRMICDEYLLATASEGAPGVDEMNWLKPVRPGDRLRARRTILGARVSRSRPTIGIVEFGYELLNQNRDVVMTQRYPGFVRRRPQPEAAA